MGAGKSKQVGNRDSDSPQTTKSPPAPPPAKAPVDNTVRAARAQQAAAHRTAGEPKKLVIEKRHLELVLTDIGPLPIERVERSTYVFELMGHPKLEVPTDIRDAYWPYPYVVKQLPVKFGSLGNGLLWVYKDDHGVLHTAMQDQVIPFEHPGLPQLTTGERFALTVNAVAGVISGELVLTTDPSQTHGFVPPIKKLLESELPAILELDDLQGVETWLAENQLGFGKYELAVMLANFRLDGVFPQSGAHPSFFHLTDGRSTFEAFADVEAKGVAKTVVPIVRDSLGELSAHARLDAALTPLPNHKLFGALETSFERGRFFASGRASYVSDKIQGEVEIELTELRAARELTRRRLGALAPPDPTTDAAANGLALTGAGLLEFNFNSWLQGRAEVIVDPDGYITTLGQITPDAQIEVFSRKTSEKTLFDESDWGVAWVDIIPVPYWWGISLKAHAYVGPGLLGDLSVEGVYSTHPGVSRHFSIAGTLIVPAEIGADLYAYFKGGIPKLANAGGQISANAKVQIHAGVRPRIGWDRPARSSADDPVSGRYFIDGSVFAGADVSLGLSGGVTAQIVGKSASWKPLHHTWKLGKLRFQAGGKVYLDHPLEPSAWSFDPHPRQSKADYERLLDDATVDKLPSGDGRIDRDTPTWVDGVTDVELEPKSTTPPEPQLGPIHIDTPTLAGGDLPADEHVDPSAPAAPTTPAPVPPEQLPKTRPATEMPAPEPLTQPPDLVEDFTMEGAAHQLFLTRGHPPQLLMASMPPRSPLTKRLSAALDALDRIIASPPPGRSTLNLDTEREWLDEFSRMAKKLEDEARDLSYDVSHGIPDHFPGLPRLAGELHAYAELFDRKDLLVDLPTGGRRSLKLQDFDEVTVRRKLEQQRLVPNDRDRVVKSLREVPVGSLVAEYITSGRFDQARHYDHVLKQLKSKTEVGDTLIVFDVAARVQDAHFEVVFEAQLDPDFDTLKDEVDIDVAGIRDGVLVYAIAVKRPRDVSTLAKKINEGIDQLNGVITKKKGVVAYVFQGTRGELESTYRSGVTAARDKNPDVQIVITFPDGTQVPAEDL